jgi:hypothetical protein
LLRFICSIFVHFANGNSKSFSSFVYFEQQQKQKHKHIRFEAIRSKTLRFSNRFTKQI